MVIFFVTKYIFRHFFIHLKLELKTVFPAKNKWKNNIHLGEIRVGVSEETEAIRWWEYMCVTHVKWVKMMIQTTKGIIPSREPAMVRLRRVSRESAMVMLGRVSRESAVVRVGRRESALVRSGRRESAMVRLGRCLGQRNRKLPLNRSCAHFRFRHSLMSSRI